MEDQDRNVIIAVALMAALADRRLRERAELQSAMTRKAWLISTTSPADRPEN
jgi:hypothetical protein